MKALVLAGLPDNKLISKLSPIAQVNFISEIILLRRTPITVDKVKCITPPEWIQKSKIVSEIYRIFVSILQVGRPDVEYIIGIHYKPHAILAYFLSLVFRKKLIVLIVEDPKYWHHGKKLFLKMMKKAYYIGVRGSHSKQYLLSLGINEEKIFIHANQFQFDALTLSDNSARQFDLIFIGNSFRVKRLDIFLDIVSTLKQKRADVKAVIIGDGYKEEEIKKRIAQYDLNNNVSFLGRQNDIYHYLNDSKILVVTSESEGLPMVMVEAMSCGVPCVVPNVGDITDVAIDQHNSIVVPALYIEKYVQACDKLLSDHEFYTKLSQNARNIKEERQKEYSLESISQTWEQLLNEQGEKVCVELQEN